MPALARKLMTLNLTVAAIFAASLFLRGEAARAAVGKQAGWLPLVLSLGGALILTVSGWIGGHLVYVQGVAVDRPEREEAAAQRRRAA